MKCLLQRVRQASVEVDQSIVGSIRQGILVFVGIEKGDSPEVLERMTKKILAYRIFADSEGRMNRSISEINGEILCISQFTLAADTQKGLRPSFSSAAPPEKALQDYHEFVSLLNESGLKIATGTFGADMQVALVNDGPVTFLLEM